MSTIPGRRQRGIASLGIFPFAGSTPVVFEADHLDVDILTAWNERQSALGAIERRGRFYACEEHSPQEAAAFDIAEEYISEALAKTPEGVFAKLWVALSQCGGGIRHDWQRAVQDVIRRADLNEVAALGNRLRFDQQAVFTALLSFAAQIGGQHRRQ